MSSVNRLVLTGTVPRAPKTLTGINGVPHSYFLLEHRSMQMEAGHKRPVYCKIQVVLSGHDTQPLLRYLELGCNITVAGFVGWQQGRDGQSKLVLHADTIEPIC
ncbi:restart primosome assembly protein PriB [Ferrimonas balearica DSM 9799]|uniref:Replication restart protein PriB n=1 Tax=Ferrimonas balearica (strain DSM 9799 / CCM 4581 / KCTC 23876 / PAT) TaxID=550540 RepID=E1SPS7_FERBD|nr:primosomal replication protein N [Ferrimonas balearica]ADN74741.1 restart primosome assembly protein PriB [Ferrimonas balearica DSM 9799]MBY6018696.1 primosomal replication protein N [Halomonas denitrificans]MBW3140532.1 primosomal replication protein N [Ferrimonas balearica]MBW3165474.1 primosomal replication protein N [Ferrimonas balearica]MBY5981312.1 primosomal replication protein N [Ferrimonas balearica]